MQELRDYINNILGDVNRCLLPSNWWKKIFNAIVNKIENLEETITKNVENILKKDNKIELNLETDDFDTLFKKCIPLYTKLVNGTLDPSTVKITPYTASSAYRFISVVCSEDHIQLVCDQCVLSGLTGRTVVLHFYKDKEGFDVQPLDRGLIHDFSGASSSSMESWMKDNTLMTLASPFYIDVVADSDDAISRPLCIRQESWINPEYYIVDYFYANKFVKLKVYTKDGSIEKLDEIYIGSINSTLQNLQKRIEQLESK